MNLVESHIVTLLQQQDPYAISMLYDRYAPTLYGIVLRIVHSKEVAEDVIQEAFVKAWKHGATYDVSKGTLFTWLLNIARNTAIDKTRSANFKRNGKIQTLDDTVNNTKALSEEPDVEHIGLNKMVNELEEKHRVIIDLVYFKGYTHAEVTDYLNIPLGTVKTRLRIALRELRKFFEEQRVILWLVIISQWLIG